VNAPCTLLALAVVIALVAGLFAPVAAAPEGQVTFALHVTLAPTWFDPAEVPGVVTPFMTLDALHDALVKPMHERAMFAPLVEPPLLSGVGGRLAEVPTTPGHPFVSPYEDLKLRAK
jgi:hypothetical protein